MIATLPYHVHAAVLRMRFLYGNCPCSSSKMTKQCNARRSHTSVICLEHVLALDAQSFASSRLLLSEKATSIGTLHLIPNKRPENVEARPSYKTFIRRRHEISDGETTTPVRVRTVKRAVNRPEQKSHLSMPTDPWATLPYQRLLAIVAI